MRIINGKYRGKSIIAPKILPVRPTTDFAKEGLFNVLSNQFDIEEIEILDLFSGTGNIAIEFASRGAKKVLCIDQNYHCVSFIKKMKRELAINQLSVFKNDTFKYLKQYKQSFDIIFADPPYEMKDMDKIAELVFENNLLNENGWLIIEHDKHTDLTEVSHFSKQRKYGNVNFSIFEN
jgi:16S rRNA (guanine(966)-N(2))-methyltransferase RsmD